MMAAKLEAESKDHKDDVTNLLILILIASAVGIYLIATTVLIAKDGVFYIEQAQKFSSDPIKVIKGLPFGYPFLIFAAHKFAALFGDSSSIHTWIYSAQSITLLCRLLALIPLYFIGKLLIGSRKSFWAILILIVLPYPAKFGSDVLRDWPHILFLATGFLFLLCGANQGKWWMFGVTGLAAGLGHIIRPECAQLVIYGVLWLLIRLLLPKRNMDRPKLVCALSILLICFVIPVAPYMKARGRILPEKLKGVISSSYPLQSKGLWGQNVGSYHHAYAATSLPSNMVKATGRLIEEVSDNLFYFFVPALVIGISCRFRRISALTNIEKFFVPAFMVQNVAILILLHCNYEYISRRHSLPLVTFSVFYVPIGLQVMGNWLESKGSKGPSETRQNSWLWFLVLLAVGIAICLPKLLRPLRIEKRVYTTAAEWIKENTGDEDLLAVSDPRISFYAERKSRSYLGNHLPSDVKYVVRAMQEGDYLSRKIALCDVHIVNHTTKENRVIKELVLGDFKKNNPKTVALKFSVPEGQPLCEFRVYLYGGNDLTLQAVDLRPAGVDQRVQAKKSFDILGGKYRMATTIGVIDRESHQIRAEGVKEGFLAYGPYIPLNKGNYEVKFRLKLNNPESQGKSPRGMTEVWSSSVCNKKEKEKITIYRRI